MSLWFEIIICVSIPIFLIFLIIVNSKLKNIQNVNNGIFKQSVKTYRYLSLSGLIDMAKDLMEAGIKIRNKRKEMNEDETD